MRLGPCRRTSASAMTRLTGGVRSSGGIGARIDTMPFPGCIGEHGCGRTLPRNTGRPLFRPAHLATILVVGSRFGNTLSRQCATYRTRVISTLESNHHASQAPAPETEIAVGRDPAQRARGLWSQPIPLVG